VPAAGEPTVNRSVLVWIHGGSLVGGNGKSEARWLAHDGNIVVVSINYRLGPLGYLYTEVVGHDGNYGLHDQLLALHWVKENIVHFGGDPNQVTIAGQSAGSWSVSALVLCPLAKGLFHRAIMQSGAATTATISKEVALKHTVQLAIHLNCTHEGPKMITCLRGKTVDQLLQVS